MQRNIKQGEATFLTIHPEYRGNVSAIEGDRFRVTWHKSYSDVPPVQGESIDREHNKRMRVWYQKGNPVVGFGVPD